MGTWGTAPYDNDEAADWIAEVFAPTAIDQHIEDALKYDDTFGKALAAAYLICQLGHSPYVWPGDLELLDGHIQRVLDRLQEMAKPDSEYMGLTGNDPDFKNSIEDQIAALKKLQD